MIVTVPWGSWYKESWLPLCFPDTWHLQVCNLCTQEKLQPQDIQQAIQHPIGKPLRQIAQGRRNAVIAIDDITRPTRVAKIMPFVLDELQQARLSINKIRVIIASGAHRPAMRWDIKQKLGSRLARILDVHPHNPYENLVFMGTSKFGISIFINKIFAESDLKLAIGSITPHESVGFGGGRKTVAIGLAGIETLANFHNRDEVVMTGEIHPNPQHDNLIEIAQKAGLEFIINSVFAPSGNMSALVVGDPIQAHLTGVNLAKKLYATPMPPEADIVILNAYPKDTDLLQSCMALNVTFFPNQHIVRSGGTIVITSACPEGTGMHFLAGSGMRNPVSFAKETFKNYHLVIVSPNLTRNEVLRHFPENVNFYNRWRETLQALVRLHGNRARVAIYPHAPLHLPEESK